jgi:RNA polymerase sigma-70 factor (ECF subfamily)
MTSNSANTASWAVYLQASLVAEGETKASAHLTAEFLAVLRQHQNLLYQIIRTYGPEPQDWRDLEQEIILQLWRSFPKYDNTYKLSTWVYRIAFNVTVTEFRKKSRRQKHERTRPDEHFFRRIPAPGEDKVKEERREALYRAIRTLPPGERSVLLLHLEDEMYV